MAKNIMPDIAKLLGVEIGEEFNVRFAEQPLISSDCDVCITQKNIVVRNKRTTNDTWQPWKEDSLYDLFNGTFEVVRKPFKPQYNSKYWTYSLGCEKEWQTVWKFWENDVIDYMRLKLGLCFRTEEEALQNRPRMYKELTGRVWQEND